MKYNKYTYRYPPRPETQIPASVLDDLDNEGEFLAQPKLNGSCMELYTNGKEVIVMNRHKKPLAHKLDVDELRALHRGKGWMLLVGELMNKNKKDENNKYWNHKFVIFDILVNNGEYLIGSTFGERYLLLEELYSHYDCKILLNSISDNCFRVSSITTEFKMFFDMITPFDMYEGLVLKRINGKLENGISQKNNTRTQLKCRKPTKNYSY